MLGITRTATEQEIKSAYRKLALQYHPDRNPGNPEAEEKFKEASEAYSVLADSNKRAQYDRFGHAGVGGGFGAGGVGFDPTVFQDFSDLFGDLFGFGDIFGASAGRRRTREQRGADLRADLSLDFEEAAFGAEKEVTIARHEVCEECHGSGAAPGKAPVQCRGCGGRGQVRYQQGFFSIARTCPQCGGIGQVITDPCTKCRGEGRVVRNRKLEVKIPAGIEDGTRIRVSGKGEAGVHGGHAGDLYVVVHVKEHPFFEREGKDLYCAIPVSFAQATLGAEIGIPTLEGEQTLRIPEGTQSGTVLRLKNKGLPAVNGFGKGDLYIEVQVQTPSKLTKRQRELLLEFDAGQQIENKPERRSLLAKMKEMFG